MAAPRPQSISDLIVIEAPGKLKTMQRLAWQAGFKSPWVFATSGHLLDLPHGELGLDVKTLAPLAFVAKIPSVLRELKEVAPLAKTIWIATDNDVEGEVIAADVKRLCEIRNPGACYYRLRLEALTTECFSREIGRKDESLDLAKLRFGRARRWVDRFIGYGFSDPERPNNQGKVGRVQTGALHYLSHHPARTGRMSGVAGQWVVEGAYFSRDHREMERVAGYINRHADRLDRLRITTTPQFRSPPPACDAGDVLSGASDMLKLPVDAVARHLQHLYEVGDITYWRSDDHDLPPPSLKLGAALAAAAGIPTTSATKNAPSQVQPAHGAVVPTASVDLGDPRRQTTPEKALLSFLGRRLVVSLGVATLADRYSVDSDELGEWVKAGTGVDLLKLGAVISVSRWAYPRGRPAWRALEAEALLPPLVECRLLSADVAALHAMVDAGLGRPSTYVDHITRLIRRGFVGADGHVTRAGLAAIDYAEEHAAFLTAGAGRDLGLSKLRERVVHATPVPEQAAVIRSMIAHLGVPQSVGEDNLRHAVPGAMITKVATHEIRLKSF